MGCQRCPPRARGGSEGRSEKRESVLKRKHDRETEGKAPPAEDGKKALVHRKTAREKEKEEKKLEEKAGRF